LPPESWH